MYLFWSPLLLLILLYPFPPLLSFTHGFSFIHFYSLIYESLLSSSSLPLHNYPFSNLQDTPPTHRPSSTSFPYLVVWPFSLPPWRASLLIWALLPCIIISYLRTIHYLTGLVWPELDRLYYYLLPTYRPTNTAHLVANLLVPGCRPEAHFTHPLCFLVPDLSKVNLTWTTSKFIPLSPSLLSLFWFLVPSTFVPSSHRRRLLSLLLLLSSIFTHPVQGSRCSLADAVSSLFLLLRQ